MSLTALDERSALACWRSGSNSRLLCRVLSLSSGGGAALSAGSARHVTAGAIEETRLTVRALSPTRALVCYARSTSMSEAPRLRGDVAEHRGLTR